MAGVFDFTTFPTLTTERLVLRELTLDDTNDVFEFRRDFEVQKYNSAPMRDPAEAAALIEELLAEYAAHRSIHWGVTLRGDGRVEAETIADNHGPVRLLNRFGFVREGSRRAYSLEADGLYHDGAIYGLLHGEFQQTAG